MSHVEDGEEQIVAVALTPKWARWHRPQAARSRGWRAAIALCGLFVLGPSLAGFAHAQAIEVQNTLISKGLPSDTGNGSSSPAALSSADGRYVVFSSTGANFVPGIADSNNTTDVFLHDRTTQHTVLVSRSAASATTTANNRSFASTISADGEWVLFQSNANNLVPGVADGNGFGEDVFLYQRSTGAVILITRSATSATTTANGGSTAAAISADGEWVLFQSNATNLVFGISDSNGGQPDVFLYQRSTGAVRLVSRSAASATTTANRESVPTAMSADGEWALFGSSATDLVSGVTDIFSTQDAFLYRRSTGAVSLVSRSASSATMTANGSSWPTAISADGEWVLFGSGATDLAPGVTDNNGLTDLFLYRRSTGGVSLVSRSAASATTTANSGSASTGISADGEWVLFGSGATDLVSGVTDDNGTIDAFLYRRSTGAVSLVSHSAATTTMTANDFSLPIAISADGGWVLFRSTATNVASGVTDSNGSGDDVFLYQRSTGAVSVVSRSAASATSTANGQSIPTAISADGEWVLFRSSATNLVSEVIDSNGTIDAFMYQRSTKAISLVSRAGASATTGNNASFPTAISADGEWVLLQSRATNLISGVTDSNGFGDDVFLQQRSTGTVSLVSRAAASATTTGNSISFPAAISADGEWVLFQSRATNLLSGVTDSNGSDDVFLYRRSTGAVSLVSRSGASPTTTANSPSFPTAISADGEWVLFQSRATNLVSGVTDSNGTVDDVFLYQRSTGAVSLVSRAGASTTTTANNLSFPAAMSADGVWVMFYSAATNLVSGVTDSNGNLDTFLYQHSTGAVSLVSRSAASATTTANNQSIPAAISADGEWVLFQSNATNLVPGVTNSNGAAEDVFLYRRSTGAVSLVSRSAASATTTANSPSFPTAISADGEWVLFQSRATDLVSGVTDSNGFDEDVFLYQRSTGAMSLVSISAASATTTASDPSFPSAISADGKWVLFFSTAVDVVPGVVDSNGAEDAFLAPIVDPQPVFADGFESAVPVINVPEPGR